MLKHIKERQDGDRKTLAAKGFTLIELLVVIVILGILAAVVVFAVGGITDRGKRSACKTDLRTVKTAVEAYNAKYDDYPVAAANLIPAFLSEQSTQHPYTGGPPSNIGGPDVAACNAL